MIEKNHDELHDIIDNQKDLKKKSDRVHKLPENSLDETINNKKLMMEIYAAAIGCENVDSAKESIAKAIGYIKKQCNSFDEWKKIPDYEKHIKEIRKIGESFKSAKKCCSPNGNNYICFCDKVKKERKMSKKKKITISQIKSLSVMEELRVAGILDARAGRVLQKVLEKKKELKISNKDLARFKQKLLSAKERILSELEQFTKQFNLTDIEKAIAHRTSSEKKEQEVIFEKGRVIFRVLSHRMLLDNGYEDQLDERMVKNLRTKIGLAGKRIKTERLWNAAGLVFRHIFNNIIGIHKFDIQSHEYKELKKIIEKAKAKTKNIFELRLIVGAF